MQRVEFSLFDAAYNLALEETLFDCLPVDHPGYFILWQNKPVVIIGRNQLHQQCAHMNFAKQEGIKILRRNTGGGAVYQDLGNLNYSFIAWERNPQAQVQYYLEKIKKTLNFLKFPVFFSGRNDLEIHGKKFSGCSQLRKEGKLLLHGTLLINCDLEKMNKILKVDESKFKSKGVASQRARTMNLADFYPIDLEKIKACLFKTCASFQTGIDANMYTRAEDLVQSKYYTKGWNYEKSPPAALNKQKRFSWGEICILAEIKAGKLADFQLRGDIINLQELEEIEKKFIGQSFDPESIKRICEQISWPDYIYAASSEELNKFLVDELFE